MAKFNLKTLGNDHVGNFGEDACDTAGIGGIGDNGDTDDTDNTDGGINGGLEVKFGT